MKKLAICLFFTVFSYNSFAQGFATFDPIIDEPVRSAPANNLDQAERVTGYELNESGTIISKVQLKVSIQDTEFGERVQVVGIYNVNPGFGASWEKHLLKQMLSELSFPLPDSKKLHMPTLIIGLT